MTFEGETSEHPANFREGAWWMGLLCSTRINQYHILHDIKNRNVMVPKEFNFLLLGNTINHRAGISSKAFPFEASSLSLTFRIQRYAASVRGYNPLRSEKFNEGTSDDKGEEEEKGDTGDEHVQGECIDYLSTFAHDLIEDRYYLDDDDSTDKFNSNRIDVCPWPNIDFDIVFHAVLPHTSREVNIPYIHLKKRGPHNSRNH
ncbi:hypothetical protein V1477_021155 [Vespula maculifrons]|uniref:Uncharacterized protein n=1 Tax=Vespula maculifrons TaxID=7453 RepID=A0ABD2AHB2_VESMC